MYMRIWQGDPEENDRATVVVFWLLVRIFVLRRYLVAPSNFIQISDAVNNGIWWTERSGGA